MKNLLFLFILFLAALISVKAQNALINLTSIEHGHGNFSYYDTDLRPPISVQANQFGGNVETNLKLNNGCTEVYSFTWTFDRDISKIKVGQIVHGNLNASRIKGNCPNNTANITVSGSNNGSTLKSNPLKGHGGIVVYGNRAVAAGYDHEPRTSKFSIEVTNSRPNNTFFTVRIASTTDASNHDVFDYELRYNYSESISDFERSPDSSVGSKTSSSSKSNCYALLGLGKLVNGLVIGAYEGYGAEWMIKTIDYALVHVKSTNCISPQYLTELRKRMVNSSNTNAFMNEISAYSRALEDEILGCDCCSDGGS